MVLASEGERARRLVDLANTQQSVGPLMARQRLRDEPYRRRLQSIRTPIVFHYFNKGCFLRLQKQKNYVWTALERRETVVNRSLGSNLGDR